MRTTLSIIAVATFFLASCSSGSKMQSTSQGDDLYVAKTDPYVQPQYTPSSEGSSEESYEPTDPSTSDKYADQDGTNGNYYGSDNGYTSSLNHWYGPSLGFGYYSPFYMGFGYNPYYYSPGLSFSFSFGWGSPWPSYYYPWYSPYYSYYYPWYYSPWYNPYYGNYWNDGYYGCGGYNNYYYGNSYYGYNGSSSNNTSNDPNGGRPLKLGDDNTSPDGGIVSSTATVHQFQGSAEISNDKGVNVNPDAPGVKGDDDIESSNHIQSEKAGTRGNSPSVTPGTKINNFNSPADNKSGGAPSNNSISPRQNNQNKPPRTTAFIPREQKQLDNAAGVKNSAAQMVHQQQYKVIQQDGNLEDNNKGKSSIKVYGTQQHSNNPSDSRKDKQPEGKQFDNDNNNRSFMNSGNYSRNDNSGGNSRPSNDNRNSDRNPRKQ